ncbi:hypothetical protein KSF78_0008718, partial [Schistosoma japonicum]
LTNYADISCIELVYLNRGSVITAQPENTEEPEYKTFQEWVPEKFADDEKCEQLKAAMSDTYGRFGEAVFSCWVEGGKYHLKLSTEVLVQIGLFGSHNNLIRRVHVSVSELEFMQQKDVAVVKMVLQVENVDNSRNKENSIEYLHFLDTYCDAVKTLAKKILPQLESVKLSCDIDQSEKTETTTTNQMTIFLAFSSKEMSGLFSTEDWFMEFQKAFSTKDIDDHHIRHRITDKPKSVKWCQRVVKEVRSLEKRLANATLSCDIDLKEQTDATDNTIHVKLAGNSSEMVKSFSLEDWFPKYKTFQERVPEKFADDEKCEQLKAAMSDTYGRFGEAVFSCWIVDGIYRLNLSTEVLVQIGLFGCDNNLMERISRSVIRLQSMKLTDVTTTTIKPTDNKNNVGRNTLTHKDTLKQLTSKYAIQNNDCHNYHHNATTRCYADGTTNGKPSANNNKKNSETGHSPILGDLDGTTNGKPSANNNKKNSETGHSPILGDLGHSIGHLPASAESNEPIIVKVNELNHERLFIQTNVNRTIL